MNKFAQILNDKVHWIFSDEMSLQELYLNKFNPEQIKLIDITGNQQQIDEGWDYIDGQFIDPNPPKTLEQLKTEKYQQISTKAQQAYTSGFVSECTGNIVTYDSQVDDQDNIRSMYLSTLSPDFDTDPIYQGKIPIRGVQEGELQKQTFLLDKAQMQKLVDDLNRHIGTVKFKHWQLQEAINNAQTKEELELITWE